MKKTISILMIAMMILTSGVFAVYAGENEDGQNQTNENTFENMEPSELTNDQPETTPGEGEPIVDVDGSALNTENPENNEVVIPDTEEPQEDLTRETTGQVAGLKQTSITKYKDKYHTTIEWEPVDGENVVYDVVVNDEVKAEKIASTNYTLTGLVKDGSAEYNVIVKGYESAETAEPSAQGSLAIVIPDEFPDVIPYADDGMPWADAQPGKECIYVRWQAEDSSLRYIIKRSNDDSNFTDVKSYDNLYAVGKEKGSDSFDKLPDNSFREYFVYKDADAKSKSTNYYYRIAVVAVDENGMEVISEVPVRGQNRKIDSVTRPIRQMYINATFKVSRKLTSHDKYKKTKTFKKGTKIKSLGVSSGKYIFEYTEKGKTYTFYVKAISMKDQQCVYTKAFNYSRWAAEKFVNDKKITSKKKNWLIWTSLYTQHIYVFNKGANGKWVCVRDYECASGSAKRSTPTGDRELWQHIKTRHSRKWWSSFSNINSFHSKLPKQGVGKPGSNGCIRLEVSGAKWIYDNVPLKTKVYIY